MTLSLLFAAVLPISLVTYGVAAAMLLRLRRESRGEPRPDFLPPVSIVKPLCGVDDEIEQNLESFYWLEYGDFEIVFSFASEDDPALPIARRVADRYPERRTVFVVDGREPGANAKVNRLAAGTLRARSRYLLFSDGNVRVRPDFLSAAISWFSDERVGLVSHLFRGTGASTLGSRLECLHLNGVLRAGTAAIAGLTSSPCVVGKSILISRAALESIGGFRALQDFLAEDFLFGTKVQEAGYRVVLSADELDTTEISKPISAFWSRHRRWAILRRRLGGPAYAFEMLAAPFFWFLCAVLFSHGSLAVIGTASLLLTLRYGLELGLRGAGERRRRFDWVLLPLRDLVVAGVFWAGLFGRSTIWRGRAIRVGARTLIESGAPARASLLASSLRVRTS